MKKKITTFILLISCFYGCKKGGSAPPPPVTQAECAPSNEFTALSGNQASWKYEFDAKGNPTVIKKLNPNGSVKLTFQIFSHQVIMSYEYLGKQARQIIDYDADIFTSLPSKAFVSLDDGVTLKVHYYTYFFFYDIHDRLKTVGEQTDYVLGDREYDLNIFYNDQNNVTGLQYVWTTGPNLSIPPVTVKAYDTHPTPYAAIKCWKFLMINFNWDNSDPEPLLTALSSNNPLDYSLNLSPTSNYLRTMSYSYNDKGFPLVRTNTNKTATSEYTFQQTFTYNCK